VLALSPRGTHLAYWADNLLHVRALERLGESTALRGSEAAREPFFSPDGKWIGFFADGHLRRVSIDGGAAIPLGAARNPWGATWDADGMVRYGQGTDGIWMVPGTGGSPTQLVKIEEGAQAHGPQLLPGGEWLLFSLLRAGADSWDEAQIVLQSIRTGERRVVIERGRDARYVPTGHLVYGLDGTLMAVPFRESTLQVSGGAVPLVENVVDADVRSGAVHFSVSDDGSLVYLTGPGDQGSSLAWVTAEGRQQPLPAASLRYGGPRVSPDGTRAVFDVERDGNYDVGIYDFKRNVLTTLTSGPAREQFPMWTPDGQGVVFYSDADGGGLFRKAADGTGTAERLSTSSMLQLPYSWSADGRGLLFLQTIRVAFANLTLRDPGDVFVLSTDKGLAVTPLLRTPAFETHPILSPDSKWLAYTESEGRGQNVYVRPFPRVEDGRWQVSIDGGGSPLWSPDGRWLYYYTRSGRVFGVPVETSPTFRLGSPTSMFDLPPVYSSAGTASWRMWDIAPDGRFLTVVPGGIGQSQVVVVLNWTEELERLVPSGGS
jgi:serine/threonine-protein kinase